MQDVNSIDIFEADLSNTSHVDAAVLLIDLYAREVNGTGQGLQDDVKAALPKGFASHPTTQIFLAMIDDSPAGVAVCFGGYSTFRAKPILNIHDLAVHPDYRSKGVGSALLHHVESAARSSGCGFVTLEVDDENPRARKLYKRFGFKDSGPDETTQFFMKKAL